MPKRVAVLALLFPRNVRLGHQNLALYKFLQSNGTLHGLVIRLQKQPVNFGVCLSSNPIPVVRPVLRVVQLENLLVLVKISSSRVH